MPNSHRSLALAILLLASALALNAQYNPQGGRTSAEEANKQSEHDRYVHDQSEFNTKYTPNSIPSPSTSLPSWQVNPGKKFNLAEETRHSGDVIKMLTWDEMTPQQRYEVHYARAASYGGEDAVWIGDYCLTHTTTNGPCDAGSVSATKWYYTASFRSNEGKSKYAARLYDGVGEPANKELAVRYMQETAFGGYKPSNDWLRAHNILPDADPGSPMAQDLARADVLDAGSPDHPADRSAARDIYGLYEQRNAHAKFRNELFYYQTSSNSRYVNDAFQELLKMADAGNLEAIAWKAQEISISRSRLADAVKAAEAGDTMAAIRAGNFYYGNYLGLTRDHVQARRFYAMAANTNSSADLTYGIMLYEGDGGPVDTPEGLSRIRKEAKANNQEAANWLKSKGIKK